MPGAGPFIKHAGWLDLPPLPPLYRCVFDAAAFQPAAAGLRLPPEIERSVLRRQAEFVAGRLAASACLATWAPDDFRLLNGADRAPVWPAGVVGSITHTRDMALCAVLPAATAQGIGIDAEQPVEAAVAAAVRHSVVTDAEWDLVRAVLPGAAGLIFSFSAKESLFKALYPQVRRFLDFTAARITHVDPAAHRFTIALCEDWSPRWRQGVTLTGHFRFLAGTIVTCLVLPARERQS